MSHKGITLIEVTVVLALLGILSHLACANVQQVFQRIKIHQISKALYADFQFARNEAIASNQMIRICGTEDNLHCSQNWSKGYIVFRGDLPEEGPISLEAHLHCVAFPTDFHIQSSTSEVFTFDPAGYSHTRGTLKIAHKQTVDSVVIFDSGRVRLSQNIQEDAC